MAPKQAKRRGSLKASQKRVNAPETADEQPTVSWFASNVKNPLLSALRRAFSGLTPKQVALAVTFGCWGGLFPIPGVTTAVCGIFIMLFRVNPVITQVFNLLLTPVDIACIPIFLSIGQALTPQSSADAESATLASLPSRIQEDFFGAVTEFSGLLCIAVLGWVVVTPVAIGVLYIVLMPVVSCLMPQEDPTPAPHDPASPLKERPTEPGTVLAGDEGVRSRKSFHGVCLVLILIGVLLYPAPVLLLYHLWLRPLYRSCMLILLWCVSYTVGFFAGFGTLVVSLLETTFGLSFL